MAQNISIIGSGNLASNLALILYQQDIVISQIYSRRYSNACNLASQVNAEAIDSIRSLNPHTDICILAVPDNAISEIADTIPFEDIILVHTAGSVPLSVLKGSAKHYAVMYALQTFSKHRIADMSQVPVYIESSSRHAFEILYKLASTFSTKVFEANSEQRLALHIAAVFTCNFTNHLYQISENILHTYDLDFNALHALIHETTDKAVSCGPKAAQTGPAKRNDTSTLKKHMDFLKDDLELLKLYKLISNSIFEKTRNE